MEVKASLKYLRIAPRKVRLVADLIKGMDVEEAKSLLALEKKRAAKSLLKLLNSAVANAKNNFHLDPEGLYVKNIRVDQGPMLKRYFPRAMGRATLIQKKTSHILIELAPAKKKRVKREKVKEIEKKRPLSAEEETLLREIKEEVTKKDSSSLKKTESVRARGSQIKEKKKKIAPISSVKKMFRRKSI